MRKNYAGSKIEFDADATAAGITEARMDLKVYRGMSKVGEYIDIQGPSRVVFIGRKGRRIDLLIVTDDDVSSVQKPVRAKKPRWEE